MEQATRDAVREGAKRSAAAVLPLVFDTLGTPSYMLDVGCGEGWWCAAAENLGVTTLGADKHLADLEGHLKWDAESGLPLPGGETRWPLALCLETAEHLTPAAGDHLVAELCRVADGIVWSAAIPGQGGDGHINEQWPDYWSKRFNHHGFMLTDYWRLELWDHPDVEPWYAQNILHAMRHGASLGIREPPLALVHPVTWAHHRGVPGPRSQ